MRFLTSGWIQITRPFLGGHDCRNAYRGNGGGAHSPNNQRGLRAVRVRARSLPRVNVRDRAPYTHGRVCSCPDWSYLLR
jgi:hypothetical protein